jgi:hypothetical protein
MCFDLGTWANVAIAIFTAVTAIAAWRAASVAKSSAEESGKIAKEQTDALMTAAKADALASRINFYDKQIAVVESELQEGTLHVASQVQSRPTDYPPGDAQKQQYKLCSWMEISPHCRLHCEQKRKNGVSNSRSEAMPSSQWPV